MTDYGVIHDVEIASAGMEWPASTGPVTLTLEHLADAVRACNEDPLILPARVKLGHTSAVNGDHPNFDPFAALGDAEPAFGRIANMRLENDGAVIVADLVEVPQWLVDAAPSAFPNRSMEATWDVTTEGGKRYSMVITAVSLLGVYFPAVKDLEDLQRFVAEGPDPTTANAGSATVPPASLSVSTDAVRQRFNFDWATSDPIDGLDTYWWWARDIRVDPDEVIADDDEGNLWSIPFTTDGADVVTFGTPVRVRQDFVPITAAAERVAGAARTVATFSRPTKPDQQTNAAEGRPDNERTPMDDSVRQALARQHGLDPETATEDEVNAAVIAAAQPEAPEGGEHEAEAEAPETPAAETAAPEPVAASASERVVTVDREQWERTQAAAEAGRQARDTQLASERDALVSAAVTDGRIAPSSRQAWREALDARPEVEAAALAALTPGRIPVDERGTSTETTARDAGYDRVAASMGVRRTTPKEA